MKPTFTVLEANKRRSRTKMTKSKSSGYQLNCEKRLSEFKKEFTSLFEQRIQEKNPSFKDYYRAVIKQTANADLMHRQKKFCINSQLDHKDAPNQKGTMLFQDNDVLEMNILDINEQNISNAFGPIIAESQTLKNLSEQDPLVQTLLFRSLAHQHKSKGAKLQKLNPVSNESSQYIYKNMHPNKPSS